MLAKNKFINLKNNVLKKQTKNKQTENNKQIKNNL